MTSHDTDAVVRGQAGRVEAPEPLNLTLMELPANGCKWPVNDGGPFLFCGHEREPGRPYCTFHENLSVGTGTASERSAVRSAKTLAGREAA